MKWLFGLGLHVRMRMEWGTTAPGMSVRNML
ncbi:MAG: hypothetical protein JWO30_3598 [Fibrobacteres bacterium]|nr:hypothetical protein [Fibrobacterota bacterium]